MQGEILMQLIFLKCVFLDSAEFILSFALYPEKQIPHKSLKTMQILVFSGTFLPKQAIHLSRKKRNSFEVFCNKGYCIFALTSMQGCLRHLRWSSQQKQLTTKRCLSFSQKFQPFIFDIAPNKLLDTCVIFGDQSTNVQKRIS